MVGSLHQTRRVGILALQGAVAPHATKLRALGVEPAEVRRKEDLQDLSGIILPGGESTTMLHLLHLNSLWEPLKEFISVKPTWGVCAGAILLAKKVSAPGQASFERLSIEVERNGYGRQRESFIGQVQPTALWEGGEDLEAVFIRAPRIREVGANIRTLFMYKGEPVMVEEGLCLASTFHPELTASSRLHEYFLARCSLS